MASVFLVVFLRTKGSVFFFFFFLELLVFVVGKSVQHIIFLNNKTNIEKRHTRSGCPALLAGRGGGIPAAQRRPAMNESDPDNARRNARN